MHAVVEKFYAGITAYKTTSELPTRSQFAPKGGRADESVAGAEHL